MLEMLMQWYRRRFSDPEAIALLGILVAGFGIIFFFSGLLAPLLVAIVLAYLLEWPTVRLQSIGCSRPWATSVFLSFTRPVCQRPLVFVAIIRQDFCLVRKNRSTFFYTAQPFLL